MGALLVIWGALSGELIRRGLAAGHWPLTSRYEFALGLAWAVVAVYLLLRASRRERSAPGEAVGVFAIVLLLGIYALTRAPELRAAAPLLPALRSAWLQVHVLSTMLGYAACGVAAGLGLAQLARQTSPGETGQAQPVEPSIERAVALGFPWLTMGLLSGAIWAQNAWGRYWGWDPKEIWAAVTWLWYLLVLHLRPLPRWRGRRLAGLAVVGFAVVLFSFVGVPWLVRVVRLESLHAF
jgi:cytochrome c-type biogenesis protein CcsB